MPPLEFEYSDVVITENIQEVDAQSLENLPAALDNTNYRWADLDGEGLSGILTEQGGKWFYKLNLGRGRFGSLEVVSQKPFAGCLTRRPPAMQDVAGDGQLDLVELSGPSCADARDANDSSITNPANFRISASVRNGSRPVMASLATPCIMDHHASSVKVCGSLRGGAAPLGASEDFADHLVVGLPESAALWMGSPTLSHYLKTIAVPFGGNVCLLQ